MQGFLFNFIIHNVNKFDWQVFLTQTHYKK